MAQGTLTAGYTDIPALFYNPDIKPYLFDRYKNQQDTFVNVLDELGAWMKGTDIAFNTGYDTPLNQAIDTTGSTSTSGTGTSTVTITGLPVAQSGILGVGKLVIMANGLQARVQDVTNTAGKDTVVLKSSAAGNPNLTFAVGDTIIPFSNAQEEGSLQPTPERWGITNFSNVQHVFRKTGGITDIARARNNETFRLDIGGQEAVGSYQAARTYLAHRADIGFGLLLGEISDVNFGASSPSLTGAQGYGVQVTRGLIPTIRDFGWNYNLATAGTPALADLENIGSMITNVRGADEYMLVGADAPVSRMSSFFKGLGSSGLTSLRTIVNNQETAVNLMVDTYSFGGRKFHLMRWNTFDNRQVIATGTNVAKSLYAIPMGTASAYSGNKTVAQPYMGVKYLPVINAGDGDEKFAQVHLGALASRPTSGTAREDWVYETICGLDIVMPYIFGSIKVL